MLPPSLSSLKHSSSALEIMILYFEHPVSSVDSEIWIVSSHADNYILGCFYVAGIYSQKSLKVVYYNLENDHQHTLRFRVEAEMLFGRKKNDESKPEPKHIVSFCSMC